MISFQSVCMIVIFLTCVVSAVDWTVKGEYATGIAFLCFGLGDLALAWEFRSGGPWIG